MPRVDRREIAAIFAGGALGTLARAALAEAFPHPATAWPWPTFGVNIAAAFALGYFVTRLTERLPLSSYRHDQALLAGTAAVGSYTTFSTWMLETQRLTEERQHRKAAVNVIVSLALGIAAAALGRLIGARL